jgi:hypothetical protein
MRFLACCWALLDCRWGGALWTLVLALADVVHTVAEGKPAKAVNPENAPPTDH